MSLSNYQKQNTLDVLNEVEALIHEGRSRRMYDVCDRLSIFDWWTDTLSVSKMKQMRSFLKTAHKMGYDGYVCFKVGASGCANGMWAHKEKSTTGHSPDGDRLYRSFSPDYTYWQAQRDGKWLPDEVCGKPYDCCKTAKQLEALLTETK